MSKHKRRGRKKKTFLVKHKRRIKELIDRFMESESAEAYIGRAVLAMVGLGGILVIGAIAPNIFSAFAKFNKPHRFSEKQVHKSVYYLRKNGLIKFITKTDGASIVKITKNGQKKLVEFAIESIKPNAPSHWDGKWRMVIFDIPERFRAARESLRHKLKEFGLFQLQRSVFAYPHPLEEEVQFIAAFFDVEQYIEILTVERMLDDKALKNYFKI